MPVIAIMKPSDNESPQERSSYIWSLPTRLFHCLLVIGIAGAFLTEEEEQISLHAALGYMAGALILFRFIWGIMGPAYSRFSDFPVSLHSIKSFLLNIRKDYGYAGHNPAASVVMILIMVFVVLTVFSGICLLTSDGKGFFAGLISLDLVGPFYLCPFPWHAVCRL
ncbi:MAG: cytochrome b/b6 domain-containing protein [Bacteroidales bacterium]|nr:cytochrome b/b6 domain-containing protein [Bacteroidales bacterium]